MCSGWLSEKVAGLVLLLHYYLRRPYHLCRQQFHRCFNAYLSNYKMAASFFLAISNWTLLLFTNIMQPSWEHLFHHVGSNNFFKSTVKAYVLILFRPRQVKLLLKKIFILRKSIYMLFYKEFWKFVEFYLFPMCVACSNGIIRVDLGSFCWWKT